MSAVHQLVQNPLRRSPFESAWSGLAPACVEHSGMRVPTQFAGEGLPTVALVDCSFLPRAGVKGEGAGAWLEQQGIALPQRHNHWLPHRGGWVGRLGHNEFLLESAPDADWTRPLRDNAAWPLRTMPVLRQDASLLLCGSALYELLAQTCSFNFGALDPPACELVMTQMIGVSVLAAPVPGAPLPALRLWCDPSFAPYLWRTLAQIAGELGGAPLGWQQLDDLGIPLSWTALPHHLSKAVTPEQNS